MGSCLTSLCRVQPKLAKKQLLPPLLADLAVASHSKAWLLPFLCPTHMLAEEVLAALTQTLKKSLIPFGSCNGSTWATVNAVSLAMLKIVEQRDDSVPLTASDVLSLLSMCSQVMQSSSESSRKDISEWVELIAHVISSCATHANLE